MPKKLKLPKTKSVTKATSSSSTNKRPLGEVTNVVSKRSRRHHLKQINYKEHSDDDEPSINEDESSFSSNEDIESG